MRGPVSDGATGVCPRAADGLKSTLNLEMPRAKELPCHYLKQLGIPPAEIAFSHPMSHPCA